MDKPILLPDWPARRLVLDAAIAWGVRHMDDDEHINPWSSPWPLLRVAILAFLRHQLTDFDERLRVRYEHDQAYRDELACQVEQAAFRKYPWLAQDPRPFPQQEDSLFLDSLAKELANLHSLRDHFLSAIKDLKRTGNARDQIAALQSAAVRIKEKIRRLYAFLVQPKVSDDGQYGRSLTLMHTDPGKYEFLDTRELPPNRLNYVGFRCPRCNASVAQRKGSIALGQGYDKVVVWSCHCLTYAVYQPPRMRPAPMTLTYWAHFVEDDDDAQIEDKYGEIS